MADAVIVKASQREGWWYEIIPLLFGYRIIFTNGWSVDDSW